MLSGVLTPEDDYSVWLANGIALQIAPLLLLYDYTFRAPGAASKEESLALPYESGVVCTDERLLHSAPFPSGRIGAGPGWLAERRLAACDPDVPLVLVNHWPLVRQPTGVLRYPEFAQWYGTVLTADWHWRFNVAAPIYGHLHIRCSTVHDGVPFEEVSMGYPRE
ncbi:metallophosphoesterase [Streptomyces spororaveus]|nr:metallophosphoesterase [Streptomyces spororaveus]MCM9082392.1 metallophosphoesterase [Streptomyces spororaveus]